LALREIERHSSVVQPGDQSLRQLTRLIPYVRVYEIIGILGVDFDVKYQLEGFSEFYTPTNALLYTIKY